METLASMTDAVCFGTLVQRTQKSKETIRRFLSAMPTDSLKVFDINLRQQYYSKDIIEESLSFSDILKINDEEIDVISRMFEIPLGQEEACRKFLDQYGLKLVILTKGSKGSVVITEDQIIPQAAEKVKVVDTVGADAFTAALWLLTFVGTLGRRAETRECNGGKSLLPMRRNVTIVEFF